MATVKFQRPSVYSEEKRNHDLSDYKYEQFKKDAGLTDSSLVRKLINVAIIGLGRAGAIHLLNAIKHPHIVVSSVVEPNEERINHFLRSFPKVTFKQTTAEEVFADDSIVLVIIATPTYGHAELVERALRSKKAVFCEKPISQNIDDISRLYQLSEEVGSPLLCAFNRRFDPSFAQIQKKVRAGHLGQVQLIKTVSRDSPLPSIDYIKISGGIFHDCIVHDIDMICWITGEFPVEVQAMAHAFIPEIKKEGDHDTVAVTMKFPSGAIGIIDVSRNSFYGYDQRVEVFGPRGMLKAHNEKPSAVEYSSQDGTIGNPIYHSFASRYERGYEEELDHAYRVALGQEEPKISRTSVVQVSRIADALELSAKHGRVEKLREENYV